MPFITEISFTFIAFTIENVDSRSCCLKKNVKIHSNKILETLTDEFLDVCACVCARDHDHIRSEKKIHPIVYKHEIEITKTVR